MTKRKVNLQDVKSALLDERFRQTLPDDLSEDVQKFLKNPGCSCNHPVYKKVLRNAATQLAQYYPGKMRVEPEEIEKEIERVSQNEWTVINCNINELAAKLRKLPPGRKQLDVARYQDQVTVIVNELDAVF